MREALIEPVICLLKGKTERGGFEPPVQCYPYNDLANRRFKPLSHLSGADRSSLSARQNREDTKMTRCVNR